MMIMNRAAEILRDFLLLSNFSFFAAQLSEAAQNLSQENKLFINSKCCLNAKLSVVDFVFFGRRSHICARQLLLLLSHSRQTVSLGVANDCNNSNCCV